MNELISDLFPLLAANSIELNLIIKKLKNCFRIIFTEPTINSNNEQLEILSMLYFSGCHSNYWDKFHLIITNLCRQTIRFKWLWVGNRFNSDKTTIEQMMAIKMQPTIAPGSAIFFLKAIKFLINWRKITNWFQLLDCLNF